MHSNFRLLYSIISLVFILHHELGATWTTPTSISLENQFPCAPQIKMNPQGKAVAVWSSSDGGNHTIQAATKIPEESWTTPVILSNNNFEAYTPQLDIDANGNAVVVWYSFDGTNYKIQSATFTNGVWTPYVDVSPSGIDAYNPQVSVDALGNAIVVWFGSIDSNFVIQSASLSFGGNWTSIAIISDLNFNSYCPMIALDAQGNATITWYTFDGVNYLIQCASMPFNGSWSTPSNLSLPNFDAYNPQIALNSSGNSIIAWYYYNGSNYIIQAASSTFGGTWSSPSDISLPGYNALNVNVHLDASGNAFAIWVNNDLSNYLVDVSQLPLNGTWTTPITISASGQDCFCPQIAADSSGNVVATWFSNNGSSYQIEASSLQAGSTWTSPIELSSTNDNSTSPQVALDELGHAIIIWQDISYQTIQTSDGENLFIF